MRKLILIPLLLLSCHVFGQTYFSKLFHHAQPTDIIGGGNCPPIVRTTDSGYLLSFAYLALELDVPGIYLSELVKTDASMNPKWEMNVTGLNPVTLPLPGGATLVWGEQNGVLSAMKLDTAGNTVWGKTIEWSGHDGFVPGYAVYTGSKIRFAGFTFTLGYPYYNNTTAAYLDLDTAGNILGADTLHLNIAPQFSTLSGITLDASGNYIITGSVSPDDDAYTVPFVMKMTSADVVSWCNWIDASYADPYVYNTLPLPSGNILFCGMYYDSLVGNQDMIGKLSPTGTLLWAKELNTYNNNMVMQQLPNGNLLVSSGAVLMEMDTAANIVWAKKYGGGIMALSPAYAHSATNWYFTAVTNDSFSMTVFNTDTSGNGLCGPGLDTVLTNTITSLSTGSISLFATASSFTSIVAAPDTVWTQSYADTCAGYGSYSTLAATSVLPQEYSITIYPNPATTILNIAASATIDNIVITNCIGQIIYTRDYSADKVQVDVSPLPPGLYIIRVNGNEVRKLVKE